VILKIPVLGNCENPVCFNRLSVRSAQSLTNTCHSRANGNKLRAVNLYATVDSIHCPANCFGLGRFT